MGKEENKKIGKKQPDDDKRKMKSLTIEEKLMIIEELNGGKSGVNVAEKWNVSQNTVSRIKKTKEQIQNKAAVLQKCDGSMMKKKYTGIEESVLEASLFEWFKQRRCSGIPISGPMLKKKALQLNNLIGGDKKFQASNGWLHRFKTRHGIRCVSMHGEKLSADVEGSEEFKIKFNNFISVLDIRLDQIYNCDKTALYWRSLPEKTLASKVEESVFGQKKQKIKNNDDDVYKRLRNT